MCSKASFKKLFIRVRAVFFLVLISFVAVQVEAEQTKTNKTKKINKINKNVVVVNEPKWSIVLVPRVFLNQIVAQQSFGGSKENVSMSGTNAGVSAGVEREFFDDYTLAVNLGYQTLNASGAAAHNVCGSPATNQCFFNVNYVTISSLAKINFKYVDYNFWFQLGGVVKKPVSKKSNSIDEQLLTYTGGALAVAGLDYKISKELFIPVSFEYEYSFNTSSAVPTLSQYGLQTGIGYTF